MPTIDELVTAFHALSPSERKAFLRRVSPRGRVPLSRDEVYEQTWSYLTQLTMIEGEPYDEWLMNLSSEDLEALKGYPKQGELEKLTQRKKERWLTEEELDIVAVGPLKHTLSLSSWLWTTQGWAVYKHDGKEKFFDWAIQQTEKLIKFKKLNIDGLSQSVRQRLGREKREHPFKGDLLTYARDAKDDFLLGSCFTWKQIPGALRHKQQRRFRGDATTFYRLQHDFINSGEDIIPISK